MGNFVIIVFDLYRGKIVIDYEEVGYLMSNFDWLGVVKDIRVIIFYLKFMGCKKVGSLGF